MAGAGLNWQWWLPPTAGVVQYNCAHCKPPLFAEVRKPISYFSHAAANLRQPFLHYTQAQGAELRMASVPHFWKSVADFYFRCVRRKNPLVAEIIKAGELGGGINRGGGGGDEYGSGGGGDESGDRGGGRAGDEDRGQGGDRGPDLLPLQTQQGGKSASAGGGPVAVDEDQDALLLRSRPPRRARLVEKTRPWTPRFQRPYPPQICHVIANATPGQLLPSHPNATDEQPFFGPLDCFPPVGWSKEKPSEALAKFADSVSREEKKRVRDFKMIGEAWKVMQGR